MNTVLRMFVTVKMTFVKGSKNETSSELFSLFNDVNSSNSSEHSDLSMCSFVSDNSDDHEEVNEDKNERPHSDFSINIEYSDCHELN